MTAVHITDLEAWCKIDFDTDNSNPVYYAKRIYLNSELVTEINIDNITEIKPMCFYNCTSLQNVTISNKVTKIGESAFDGNSSLKNVIIGKNVSQISDCAFQGCRNIRTITSLNPTPPTCGINVFGEVETEAVALIVPQESVSLYENASTWMDFWNITGKDLSGVEETLVDDVDTPAEYYNLNGVRVENPEKGVFIKRQGGKAMKVVM